jgi:hypothetical protein
MASYRCVSRRSGMSIPATPPGKTAVWGEAWRPSLYAGASRERCLWMAADWLAGWAGEGSYNGPALLLTIARSPWPAGMVGFVCRGADTIGLVHRAARSWGGRGLSARAVLLAVGWLIRGRGAEVVELRVGRDSPACQRIAVKSGFPPGRDHQRRRRDDRQGSRRLALHHRSGRARRSPSGRQLTEPGQGGWSSGRSNGIGNVQDADVNPLSGDQQSPPLRAGGSGRQPAAPGDITQVRPEFPSAGQQNRGGDRMACTLQVVWDEQLAAYYFGRAIR